MFVFVLFACGSHLPAGWEDAQPVEDLTQSVCGNSPYEAYDERAVAHQGDPLEIEVFEMPFRCAQDVEAFWMETSGTLSVLVQPVDMSPGVVASCDCLYDLDIRVGSPAVEPDVVEVVRRWDELNEDNDPVAVPTSIDE